MEKGDTEKEDGPGGGHHDYSVKKEEVISAAAEKTQCFLLCGVCLQPVPDGGLLLCLQSP